MRVLGRIALLICILALVGIVVVVVYAKTEGFSAKARPSKPEAFVAHRLLALSYPAAAKTATNPLPATPDNVSRGHEEYRHDCAVCHGDDGTGKTEIAAGLYPKVPNLRHEADMTDGELFYIIRNGVRFTGMPGWSDPDEHIWRLVLFIRDLPNEAPQESAQSRPAKRQGD